MRSPLHLIVSGVLLLAIVACSPTRTTRSAGEHIDDAVVTARVKTALARDVGTGDSIRTDVETFRGRVQLNGFVDSAETKAAATRSASKVEGVARVDNNLRVATHSRRTGELVDDGVILAKIKADLAGDPTVAGHQVNVDVRRGTVLLAGFVDTAEQRSRAAEIAKSVGGVVKVDNQVEIKRR